MHDFCILELRYKSPNTLMEIKRTISKIVCRIEPKPEGSFIARASDPGTPPLEAATREELQEKIQAQSAPPWPPNSQD